MRQVMSPASPAGRFAELRRAEFRRLDASGTVYLDYTGAALYPESLIRTETERLVCGVFGNPHSESRPSLASTEAIAAARRSILAFFDADPEIYDVVFTSNASGAMRIVAESFPFRAGSRLVLTADNHNSINGLRIQAGRRRAKVCYVPLEAEMKSGDPRPWLESASQASLFAYPAQSNFSGVQHPLEWVDEAQRAGYRVLLDAAAFTPTNALSLAKTPADFVALSFYKMFGYPTGLGSLIARRDALAMLDRRYFGGGTVQFVSVQNRSVRTKPGAERFEDGTPNFLGMQAATSGLDWLSSIGMPAIKSHVTGMTRALIERLESLGEAVDVYGPRRMEARGGAVSFNLRRNGQVVPYEHVEAFARERGVAVRGGCFCNPGAAEHAFAIPAADARRCMRGEFTIPRFRACIGNRPVGAIRVSVGIATTISDLDRLLEVLHDVLND